MAKKKLRKVGEVLLDMEPLLEELVHDHELQTGDVLNLVRGWIEIHAPGAEEEFLDGSKPEFYYGPKRVGK